MAGHARPAWQCARRKAQSFDVSYGWNWNSFKKIDLRMRIMQHPARPFARSRISQDLYWMGVAVISQRIREVDLGIGALGMASEAKPKQLKRLGSVRAIAIKKVSC